MLLFETLQKFLEIVKFLKSFLVMFFELGVGVLSVLAFSFEESSAFSNANERPKAATKSKESTLKDLLNNGRHCRHVMVMEIIGVACNFREKDNFSEVIVAF